MKRLLSLGIISLLLSPLAFAIPPVTMSKPTPAIESSYSTHTSSTVIYKLQNNVNKKLPLTISGISDGINRIDVADDCGNSLPAGPATCNIGIEISPSVTQIGSSINQILRVDYQGRMPLTSKISFSVVQPLAYVTPAPNSNVILKFLLNTTNGTFSSNADAYSSDSQSFNQLTFATVGGVQYAYVLDQNGFVYQCTLDVDGTFNTCSATPQNPPSGWAPHGIAFATVSGVQYAYITDVDVGEVYQCSLNLDGTFNSCSIAVSSTFNAPYGITFAKIAGVQYAYIADAVSSDNSYGSVYQCTLNKDGSFNTCSSTPQQGTPNWIPYSITFAKTGGTQYAYVADNGTNATNGHVYQCILNDDGSFNTCNATPANDAPTTNWVPSDIAFATLDGTQYAYIANYQGPTTGGMYLCTLNNDGSFSVCNPTPDTPPISGWQPVGIAFRFN